jgi:tetratricopeptide (TPR) repeat protein
MDARQRLERYEALGDERDFIAAKPLFEKAVAETPDADLIRDRGYLLECHARNELRLAVAQYERAIELDPTVEKTRYHLNSAYAGLREPERAVAFCEERLAASPDDVREYRFLSCAYLLIHDLEKAEAIITAGLTLAPNDRTLIAQRGELKEAKGDSQGALADWRLALELDPDDIGPLYSSAFLLERTGRLDDAADAWHSIIEWNETRGFALQAVWPKQELERLGHRSAP